MLRIIVIQQKLIQSLNTFTCFGIYFRVFLLSAMGSIPMGDDGLVLLLVNVKFCEIHGFMQKTFRKQKEIWLLLMLKLSKIILFEIEALKWLTYISLGLNFNLFFL